MSLPKPYYEEEGITISDKHKRDIGELIFEAMTCHGNIKVEWVIEDMEKILNGEEISASGRYEDEERPC